MDITALTGAPGIDLDLCAGPGGWSVALRRFGYADVGIELDPSACATRTAAGHATIRADIARFPIALLAGRIRGLIASPPCQGFSMAGLRAGLADIEIARQLLADLAAGRDTREQHAARAADGRSVLAAEPLRYALAARPEWAVCEQVPAVLPLWQATAEHLRAAGYSAWTGVLNAADYGLPQVRRRAFLIASRVHEVGRPEPTHAQDPAPTLFGPEVLPWVSMAQGIGWGVTDRPAPTVTAGGARTGGAEPFPGSARTILQNARAHGAWQPRAGTDSLRPSLADVTALQGFPVGYPWQGRQGKAFEQAGNAVPPPLAAAVLAVALDVETAGRLELAAVAA